MKMMMENLEFCYFVRSAISSRASNSKIKLRTDIFLKSSSLFYLAYSYTKEQ